MTIESSRRHPRSRSSPSLADGGAAASTALLPRGVMSSGQVAVRSGVLNVRGPELTGAVQRLEQQDRRGRPRPSPAFHH